MARLSERAATMPSRPRVTISATPSTTSAATASAASEPRPDLNDPPLIDIRNLHVTFGKQNVLRNINLRVPRGQTLAVIGESGCGKTVFLKTLIDLIRPTQGQVLFDGQDLATLKGLELVK